MDWMSKCDYHLGEHQEAIMLSDGLFESNRHYGGIYEPIADSYEQALGELELAVRTMERTVAYELRGALEKARSRCGIED